jgi:hypothetical protein
MATIPSMSKSRHLAAWSLSVAAALAAGGCGGSSKDSSGGNSANSNAGALSAEGQSAATGDIPDNQVFLVFHDRAAGYSIKYPEGWTQVGSGENVRFKDKNNVVHIVVVPGSQATPKSASAELTALKASSPSLKVVSVPKQVKVNGKPVVKSTYSTESAPNPVTGKRVTLVVDRYQLAANGKKATVDLGTPKGVDNVDAYRLMIESFRWG